MAEAGHAAGDYAVGCDECGESDAVEHDAKDDEEVVFGSDPYFAIVKFHQILNCKINGGLVWSPCTKVKLLFCKFIHRCTFFLFRVEWGDAGEGQDASPRLKQRGIGAPG